MSGAAAAGFRRGPRIGVDVGDVRVGVAASDPDGVLATPVETVQRGYGDVGRVVDIAAERAAVEVVVGLPLTLGARAGLAAQKAREFAERVGAELERRAMAVSVRLSDERLSTVSAERVLRERGRGGRERRAVVDQAAAVVILQHALDAERLTGIAPGMIVPGPAERPGP